MKYQATKEDAQRFGDAYREQGTDGWQMMADFAKAVSAMPLCDIHKRLDAADRLELRIGDGCIACSLNERLDLLEVLEFKWIAATVRMFNVMAKEAFYDFYITPIGTGLAGISHGPMASLFRDLWTADNVYVCQEWYDILGETNANNN